MLGVAVGAWAVTLGSGYADLAVSSLFTSPGEPGALYICNFTSSVFYEGRLEPDAANGEVASHGQVDSPSEAGGMSACPP